MRQLKCERKINFKKINFKKINSKKINSQKTNSKKINGMRIAALLLALSVLAGVTPSVSYASDEKISSGAISANNTNSPKEEIIYANLDSDGSEKEMHAVNILEAADGKIKDYGRYLSVRNMTTTDELHVNGDEITASTDADKLYYEGELDRSQLPWRFSISYLLDGKKISAEELAGKSGHLVIMLDVDENKDFDKEAEGAKAEEFYKNYTVQANVTLDSDSCKNITSDNATFANVGSDKQLTFTMLPNKGGRQRIDADVTDFEMDAIEINCVNMNLDIDIDGDRFDDDTKELKDGAVDLDDGVQELRDTVDDKLVEAVEDLKDASVKLNDASDKIKDGTADLKDGTDKLKNGMQDMEDGINSLYDGSVELEAGAKTLDAMSGQLTSGAENLSSNLLTAANTMSGFIKLHPELATYYPEVAGLAAQMSQLAAGAVSLQAGIDAYTDGVSDVASGAAELRSGTSELRNGAYSMYDGIAELDDGAKEFDDKIAELQDGCKELGEGVDELSDGVADLQDGIDELKDGTGELRDRTGDIDTTIDEKIDEMVGEISGNASPQSFISVKNKNVKSVQFVIKTEKIEVPDADDAEEAPEEEKGFWQKLLDLFGFITAQAAEIKDYTIGDCWWDDTAAVGEEAAEEEKAAVGTEAAAAENMQAEAAGEKAVSIKACWDKAADSTSYTVLLYYAVVDSDHIVASATTTAGSHDFAKDIAKKGPGVYYFRVYPTKLGRKGAVDSDELSVGYEIYKAVSDVYGQAETVKADDAVKKERAATPDGFTITYDNKLTWNSVPGCSIYRIIIFADDSVDVYKKIHETNYDVEKYIEEDSEYGTVEVKVSALPDDTAKYRQSSYYTIDDLQAFAETYKMPGKFISTELGLKFRNEDGEFATGMQEIMGDTYYFNDRNLGVKGWVQDEQGYWYYFGDDYKMIKGTAEVDGITYIFNDGSRDDIPAGAMLNQ